jgi:hypothetical protein
MGESQKKGDVTNLFGGRDCVLAFCASFVFNSDRFEVIRHFQSLKKGGDRFPVGGSIADQK